MSKPLTSAKSAKLDAPARMQEARGGSFPGFPEGAWAAGQDITHGQPCRYTYAQDGLEFTDVRQDGKPIAKNLQDFAWGYLTYWTLTKAKLAEIERKVGYQGLKRGRKK